MPLRENNAISSINSKILISLDKSGGDSVLVTTRLLDAEEHI